MEPAGQDRGIPGGTLITTPEVLELLKSRRGDVLVFDVMGGPRYLPGAISLVPASQGGNFEDQVQKDLKKYLERLTEGVRDRPMVFYCLNRECWMSYNAALRAIRLGYRNVLWYRGGLEAWKAAELPTQGSGGRPSRKP